MFDQETIDRLTVRDLRELQRLMEIMAKFGVSLPTVIASVDTMRPHRTWRYFPPYDDYEAALEEYNQLAERDGFRWTPPSERTKEVLDER